MNLLELYSKPDCHLCEVAKNELMQLKKMYGFMFIEIDITQSPELFEKYREDIPVVVMNGGFISRYKVDSDTLEALLKIPR